MNQLKSASMYAQVPVSDETPLDHSLDEALDFKSKGQFTTIAPNLVDSFAEYVQCTDACDMTASDVLMQWQHPLVVAI